MPAILQLTVPLTQYWPLEQLLTLPDDEFDQFLKALLEAPATPDVVELNDYISTKTSIDKRVVHEVVHLLLSLYAVRDDTSVPIPDFVESLRAAMEQTGDQSLLPPNGDWSSFRKRLETLLGVEQTLGIAGKAMALWVEAERLFQDARIFTDLRPVFRVDPEEVPAAALIMHRLKLSIQKGGEIEDIFITLDSLDIRRLRAVLNRALAKTSGLKALMAAANVPVIDRGVDDDYPGEIGPRQE